MTTLGGRRHCSIPELDMINKKGGRPKPDDAEKIGEQITSVALNCFIEAGFDKTPIDRIARIARVSKRTLYARFRTKEALFSSALTHGISNITLAITDYPANGTLRHQLMAVAMKIIESSLTKEGNGIISLLAWAAAHKPDIRKQLDQVTSLGPRQIILDILASAEKKEGVKVENKEDLSWIIFDLLVIAPRYKRLMGLSVNEDEFRADFDRSLDFILASMKRTSE